MKTPHLHELDLARIAPMSRDEKLVALRNLKFIVPPYTFNPVRHNGLDILNIEPGPFGAGLRTPWSIIKEKIIREGRSANEVNVNLRAAEALYRFADAHGLSGRRHEIFPLLVGASERLTYWFNAVVSIDSVATLVYMDPRQGEKLGATGRKFAFSIMNERIRADEDFRRLSLGIIQFKNVRGSVREAQLFTNKEIELFDFDYLDAMVRETYVLWRQVLEEREDALRRSGGGKSGSLL